MAFSIAIDGPAGAGKSTIARNIAEKLGFIYVDTGAMYRAMALFLIRKGIAAEDAGAISSSCGEAEITIRYENGEQHVILDGEDVTGMLRTEEVGSMASRSSVNGDVRTKLVELQQKLAEKENVVMDGRDIGTVVLPHAFCKIYMTASPRVRAERRCLELKEKGQPADLQKIEADIIERDHRDMTRAISPLKQADDAVLLDTSELKIDEVTDRILSIYEEKRRRAGNPA
jgi:cytidylate kinase